MPSSCRFWRASAGSASWGTSRPSEATPDFRSLPEERFRICLFGALALPLREGSAASSPGRQCCVREPGFYFKALGARKENEARPDDQRHAEWIADRLKFWKVDRTSVTSALF
jgi:hypothetical protein